MKYTYFVFSFLIFLYLSSISAQTIEKEVTALNPEEVITGEIHIKLNSEFAKPYVDDEEWEDHAFEENGYKLILSGINRKEPHKIKLVPIYPNLLDYEFTVEPKDWKLVPIEKNVKQWRVIKKIDFKRKTTKEVKPNK